MDQVYTPVDKLQMTQREKLIAMSLTLDIEKTYWQKGYHSLVGVDEVGRGCLAGPVVAAAVRFAPDHVPIPGIHDSKLLSPLLRSKLSQAIHEQAMHIGIATVSVEVINTRGIAYATQAAIMQALRECNPIDMALIDGVWKPDTTYAAEALVHGDRRCYSIAAASIVAKVLRDTLMNKLHLEFPQYQWNKNKGYGTLKHRTMLEKHGATPHHRTLFIRKALAANCSS